jgi:hypothetical protein
LLTRLFLDSAMPDYAHRFMNSVTNSFPQDLVLKKPFTGFEIVG